MKQPKINKKLNLIICAIAFILMVVYLLFVDKLENIVNALKTINPVSLIICVLFMIGYWLCESSVIHTMLNSLNSGVRFLRSWQTTIIGQYFNCITPSASGGQPMQAYYFVKFGVPLGTGITALLSRFIVYQFVLTVYSIFTLCLGFGKFGGDLNKKGLFPFVIIGFIVNTAVIVFLLCVAFWKNGTVKVMNALITVLAKLKLLKHPMNVRVYFTREVKKFFENFKFLKRNLPIIIKSCIFTFIQLTLYLSISFVLYKGFGLKNSSYLQIVSYQAYVLMISSFIPLPGAMGAAELGYSGFFRDIFGSFTGVSTMLWRIFTFYLPIIVGMVCMLTLKNRGIKEPTALEAREKLYEMEQKIINENNDEE